MPDLKHERIVKSIKTTLASLETQRKYKRETIKTQVEYGFMYDLDRHSKELYKLDVQIEMTKTLLEDAEYVANQTCD